LADPFHGTDLPFRLTYLIMIPVFVYWVLDKRSGLYVLSSYYSTVAVNAVIKLSVCAYRPWIRDSRVLPAGDAITTATGYSFPSGHTMTAGPIYGGLVGLWAMIAFLGKPLDAALGSHWGHFMSNFIIVFYCVAIVPLAIKLVSGNKAGEVKA